MGQRSLKPNTAFRVFAHLFAFTWPFVAMWAVIKVLLWMFR